MFGILTSCALASAQSEEGKEKLLFRSLGYGVWATQVADIVSTELLLRKGWEETNPLWKNDDRRRFVGYPLKIGFAWAMNKATDRLIEVNRSWQLSFVRESSRVIRWLSRTICSFR